MRGLPMTILPACSAIVATCALAACSSSTIADRSHPFEGRTIRILVGLSPGGPHDSIGVRTAREASDDRVKQSRSRFIARSFARSSRPVVGVGASRNGARGGDRSNLERRPRHRTNRHTHDAFLSIGGDSLKATQAAARLSSELQASISLSDVLEASTLADLATLLKRNTNPA